jgi:hypothetical protein
MSKLSEATVCEIPLTSGGVAVIDADDLPIISAFKWRLRVSRRTLRSRDWTSIFW